MLENVLKKIEDDFTKREKVLLLVFIAVIIFSGYRMFLNRNGSQWKGEPVYATNVGFHGTDVSGKEEIIELLEENWMFIKKEVGENQVTLYFEDRGNGIIPKEIHHQKIKALSFLMGNPNQLVITLQQGGGDEINTIADGVDGNEQSEEWRKNPAETLSEPKSLSSAVETKPQESKASTPNAVNPPSVKHSSSTATSKTVGKKGATKGKSTTDHSLPVGNSKEHLVEERNHPKIPKDNKNSNPTTTIPVNSTSNPIPIPIPQAVFVPPKILETSVDFINSSPAFSGTNCIIEEERVGEHWVYFAYSPMGFGPSTIHMEFSLVIPFHHITCQVQTEKELDIQGVFLDSRGQFYEVTGQHQGESWELKGVPGDVLVGFTITDHHNKGGHSIIHSMVGIDD